MIRLSGKVDGTNEKTGVKQNKFNRTGLNKLMKTGTIFMTFLFEIANMF